MQARCHKWIAILLLVLLATLSAQAFEARITVRETAGVARRMEPVTLSGGALLAFWPEAPGAIETRSIRLEDDTGRPIPLQIDERDGGIAFLATPNGLLDVDDELCWQVSLDPGQSREYRLFIASTVDDAPVFESDLSVETTSVRGSERIALRNAAVLATVQGWPLADDADRARSPGAIIALEIFGVQQAHASQPINDGNLYSSLHDRMEVIATGPVRTIVQLRGSRFHGPPLERGRASFWSRSFYDVEEGEGTRQYLLYNAIPLLETRERLWGRSVHPRLTAAIRFLWRAGGTPFDPETRFHAPGATETGNAVLRGFRVMLPGAEPRADVFTIRDSGDGNRFLFPVAMRPSPAETWICAAPATGQPFPLFLFDPGRVSRLHAAVIEPWMADHYASQGFDHAKSLIDIDLFVPDAEAQGGGEWRWQIWGTRETDPEQWRQVYRALVVSPLSDSLGIAVAGSEPDTPRARELLSLPPELMDPSPQALSVQQREMERDGRMAAGYAVQVTDNSRKFFRTLRAPGETNADIRWSLARRESESAQLAIVPAFRSLSGVRLEAGDLKGSGDAVIASAAWRFHEIRDVEAPADLNHHYGLPPTTRWPDPLFPLASALDVPPDRLLPLLATLTIPADTPAGAYRGELRIHVDGLAETTLAVDVRVFDFSLPERRTLLWDSWFDLDNLVRYYEQGNDGPFRAVTLDHFRANMEMLARYRAVPGLYGWLNVNRLNWIEIWREADASLTFDFSGINPWVEATQRHGNFWNPNLSCGAGWRNIFQHDSRFGKRMRNLVRDRQTGELLTLDDFPDRSAIDPRFSLIYEQFMQAWVENLREHGWLETAWHEGWDEPTGARAEAAKVGHAYLQQIVPDLKLFNYGMRPVTDDWGWGLVDAWAPNLHAWNHEYPGIERARREGIQVFAYTCGGQRHSMPDGRVMPPDINIWDANIQRRVYGWMAHKKQLDHLYIFMMNQWPAGNRETAKDPETRWPNSEWVSPEVVRPHTFWLVWPGPDGHMLPSLRLDALRDGFEDYEYLHAASRLQESRQCPELAALLDVGDLVRGVVLYEQDAETYNLRKAALGRYIETHGLDP